MTDCECRILAVLEEAGEEGIGTILNTIIRCVGNDEEVTILLDALVSLEQRSFIEFATTRDPDSLKWLPLTSQEALVRLDKFPMQIAWSSERVSWQSAETTSKHFSDLCINVLLTTKGQSTAVKLLKKYGWNLINPPD